MNAWIRAHYSDYRGAILCDWDATIRTPAAYTWVDGLSDDGVHPNAAGAAAIAPVVAAAFTAL